MYLEIDGREVGVQFIGKFNVSNLLAVTIYAVVDGSLVVLFEHLYVEDVLTHEYLVGNLGYLQGKDVDFVNKKATDGVLKQKNSVKNGAISLVHIQTSR